jgi:thiamine pyrophosphate-dependent acetolactate synthase large subunit-like protein
LGYALPTAIDAQIGKPEQAIVVVAGDAALQFTPNESIVAVAEKLPLIATVWNNHGYGEIRNSMFNEGVFSWPLLAPHCDAGIYVDAAKIVLRARAA